MTSCKCAEKYNKEKLAYCLKSNLTKTEVVPNIKVVKFGLVYRICRKKISLDPLWENRVGELKESA